LALPNGRCAKRWRCRLTFFTRHSPRLRQEYTSSGLLLPEIHVLRFHCVYHQSMRPPTANILAASARWSLQPAAATPASAYGRAAAYRRISTSPAARRSPTTCSLLPSQTPTSALPFLRSDFLPQDVLFRTSSAYARHFSSRPALHDQAQKQKGVRDEAPEPQWDAKKSTTAEGHTAEQAAGEEAKKEGEEAKEKKAGEEEAGEQKAKRARKRPRTSRRHLRPTATRHHGRSSPRR
jgi:hypothetical protein